MDSRLRRIPLGRAVVHPGDRIRACWDGGGGVQMYRQEWRDVRKGHVRVCMLTWVGRGAVYIVLSLYTSRAVF